MKEAILFLSALLLCGPAFCHPSFVVSPSDVSRGNAKEGGGSFPLHPIIYEMDITSNISNRFAKTLVISKVRNSANASKETTFTVILPDKAFISEFVMEIDGTSYKAQVKEKEEAKQIYNEAVSRGQSAGHVAVSARDSNRFTVSVNIEPESKAAFKLTYEELLERKNNQYELILNIHPGQIVKNMIVKVQINESRPLRFVKTPSLRSGNEISKNKETLDPSSDIQIVNQTTATVKFNPGVQKQKEFARGLGTKESQGLSGQFVVQYDVQRDPHGGEVLLEDGYFVHFFAPSDLEPLPKHVVFTLDTSGSMWGDKISQVKDAINSILNEVRKGDLISFVTFSDTASVWDIGTQKKVEIVFRYDDNYQEPFHKLSQLNLPTPASATNETINKAKRLSQTLYADGGTHIIGALEAALYLVKEGQGNSTTQNNKRYQPIIVFLTDGLPNGGVWDTKEIIKIITRLNSENNKAPIYSLSFGEGADKDFLRELSLKNYGFSRHIYEAADASLQLQEFYKQISSPLLSNVQFKYTSNVKNVTRINFPVYYAGSEIVVSGRYEGTEHRTLLITEQDPDPFEGFVECWEGYPEPHIFRPIVKQPVTSLERLWSYLTIKQLLEERDIATNKTELTKKALDLALRYSFVTDVTSLVVVKPNETRSVNTEVANEAGSQLYLQSVSASSQFYPQSVSGPIGLKGSGNTYYAMSAHAYPGAVALSGNSYYAKGADSYTGSYSSVAGYGPLSTHRPFLFARYPAALSPPGPSYGALSPRGPPRFRSYSAALPPPGPITGYMPFSVGPLTLADLNGPFTTPVPLPTAAPKLEDRLLWLASVLNSNRTISISQVAYELGENYTGPIPNTECPRAAVNTRQTGTCTLLSQCPQVYSALTDFQTYQQYFCPVNNKYAGVCCPK